MSDISTATSNVIPFKFGKQQVRTLLIDDQPWFVANDVSAALQYSEASAMTRHLDDDEKGLSIVQTLGGDQEMLVINESGLYSAILRSRKAEAKRFKKWVTAEVLPAIRKHGRYEDTQGVMAPMVDELLGKVGAMRLSNVMRCRVAKLDAEHQRSATAKLASAVHACFGVPRVELIPSSQFEAAANFVASYAIEGEYLPKSGNQSVDIPTDLSETQRYLVFTDGTGKRQAQPVPLDACVMSPTQFLAAVTGSNGLHVPPAALFDFALAAMEKMRWRVAA
ncbi:phage antirepressor protein [Pseudomonas edaphica]|uniref:Phage antirepressor protein n=2 Tax=Pseudomonas TaxID=286 RepID=A0A7Y8JHG4_9PSED|nr:phage antirepressor protein [Pseudomonas sp. IPO3747]NWE07173.1 phage antirepressor protein [Pseudomonas edaphica]NWE81477.1 phage antirepressor protein [Pseudomonas edaphica]